MTNSRKALDFIIRSYGEKNPIDKYEKPALIHALLVGFLLKSYSYQDKVVTAGYLHEIIKYSRYTILDISRLFGGSISSIVLTTTNVDENLSWAEKTIQQRKIIENLPNDNLAIICADKIIELEELNIYFNKIGKKDFSITNATPDELKKYYTELAKQMNNKVIPILLNRLYKDIEKTFNNNYSINTAPNYVDNYLKINNKDNYLIRLNGNTINNSITLEDFIVHTINKSSFKIQVLDENHEFINKKGIITSNKDMIISYAINDDLSKIIGQENIYLANESVYEVIRELNLLLKKQLISNNDLRLLINNFTTDLKAIINFTDYNYSKHQLLSNNLYFKDLINNENKEIDNSELTLMITDTLFPIIKADYVLTLKKYLNKKAS